jgi:hypothetical protein
MTARFDWGIDRRHPEIAPPHRKFAAAGPLGYQEMGKGKGDRSEELRRR